MREIKFRVWDKKTKKMRQLVNVVFNTGFFGVESDDNTVKLIWVKGKDIIEYKDIQIQREDNFELMQYTGLHDKNGKEIYEGDIIKILGGEYEQGFYEWDETVQIKDLIYDRFNLMMTISQIGNQAIEVIGNIWEDSDLLNDSKNTETN